MRQRLRVLGQDYPGVERSASEVHSAVKLIFKLGRAVLERWPRFAQVFARTGTNYVGMLHALQLGAATISGKVNLAIPSVPLDGEAASKRDALIKEPENPKALVEFYTAAVLQRVQTAKAKRGTAPHASAPVVGIAFSPSPERVPKKAAKAVKKLLESLDAFDVKAEDAKEKLKHWVGEFNAAAGKVKEISAETYQSLVPEDVEAKVAAVKVRIGKQALKRASAEQSGKAAKRRRE